MWPAGRRLVFAPNRGARQGFAAKLHRRQTQEQLDRDPCRFVRFHAMQSIFFSVACIIFSIAWSIAWGILFSISGFLVFVDIPLRLLIGLGFFLLWIFVMYQAYNQREYQIPFIGPIAAKPVG